MIIFVDDEEAILRGYQSYFFDKEDEWDLRYVASAELALAAIAQDHADLLVTDIRMPGMDGFSLLRKVSESHPKMLRMVISGQFDEKQMLNSVDLAQQYLFKPCDPAEIEKALTGLLSMRASMQKDTLHEAVSEMTMLPTMPQTYRRISELAANSQSSLREIGRVIGMDVSLTAKVLQLVNSAYFGLRRKIISAEEAAVFLGVEAVKVMALAVKIFSDADLAGLPKGYIDALWDHSILVASSAKAIALAIGKDKLFADNVFSCGMLHDIGRVVLLLNCREQYKEYLVAVDETYDWSLATERKFFKTDHCEIGAYILHVWGLPNVLVEPVMFSRDPRSATGHKDLATVIYAANAICHEFRATKLFRHAAQWDERIGEELLTKKVTAEWRALCAEIVGMTIAQETQREP